MVISTPAAVRETVAMPAAAAKREFTTGKEDDDDADASLALVVSADLDDNLHRRADDKRLPRRGFEAKLERQSIMVALQCQ